MGARPAIHPGQTAGDETRAAQFSRWGLGRRFIPAKQPVMKPTRPSSPGGGSAGDSSRLTAPLRAAHRCASVEIHSGQFSRWGLLPHAPCQPGASPTSALTRVPPPAVDRAAARRSSLRFGRNTLGPVLPVGAPPSRALSAGPPPGELAPPGELGLPGLGAHPGPTTGCYERKANQDRGPRDNRPVDRATGRTTYLSDRTVRGSVGCRSGGTIMGREPVRKKHGCGGRPYLLFGQTPGR